MFKFNYQPESKVHKFEQVRSEIVRNIENGNLPRNACLPSINEFSDRYGLSKVTISRAYLTLKYEGYISYTKGRGFYVIGQGKSTLRILLIVNDLNISTDSVYKGLCETLSNRCKVDLYVLTTDLKDLDFILQDGSFKYQYYVISMGDQEPGLNRYSVILDRIPDDQVIYINEMIPPDNGNFGSVF